MVKILVFDDGWGGELVANFLAQELEIVEIIRVIDWAKAPYSNKTVAEITDLAALRLRPYIGTVDAIVLAGYTVSLALNSLRQRFPSQVFVGMGINYDRILRSRNSLENVVVMAEQIVGMSSLQAELRARLPYSTIILPDCNGWQQRIDDGAMTKEFLQADLATDFVVKKNISTHVRSAQKVRTSDATNTPFWTKSQDASTKLALRKAIQNLKSVSDQVKNEEKTELEWRLQAYNGETDETDFDNIKIAPNVILLLNTHFWEIKADIEDVLGWKVRVMDFRDKLLRDLCSALKFRGVDGKRPK